MVTTELALRQFLFALHQCENEVSSEETAKKLVINNSQLTIDRRVCMGYYWAGHEYLACGISGG